MNGLFEHDCTPEQGKLRGALLLDPTRGAHSIPCGLPPGSIKMLMQLVDVQKIWLNLTLPLLFTEKQYTGEYSNKIRRTNNIKCQEC